MNEKAKIYVVLATIVIIIGVVIGYSVYTVKQSEKIYNEFEINFNDEEQKIILIGRDNCPWCQYFQPYMEYYQEKYDFSYQYINTNKLTSGHLSKILEKAGINEDDFGTPLTLFVQNGKVLNQIGGFVDETKLLEILQEQGFISEEEKSPLSYLDLDSLKKTVKNKEKSVVVFGQTTCGYCLNYKNALFAAVDDKDINIYYINCDKLEEKTEFYEYIEEFEPFKGSWGTPLTVIFEDGKVVDYLSQAVGYEELLEFLTKNKIVNEKEEN